MTDRFPHLSDAITRHSGLGNLALIGMLLWMLFPWFMDISTNSPNITGSLSVIEKSNRKVVSLTTDTNDYVYGSRLNAIFTEDNVVLCSSVVNGIWNGHSVNYWDIPAYAGCKPIGVPIKFCSFFYLKSQSGREKIFTDETFCTPTIKLMDTKNDS